MTLHAKVAIDSKVLKQLIHKEVRPIVSLQFDPKDALSNPIWL